MNLVELDTHIRTGIQGVFSVLDMEVLKREIQKLGQGQVYLEIGVDEGRSMTVAHHYADPGVLIVGVDIHNVDKHELSVGRGKWMEQEEMIGINRRCFFVHGDADIFAYLWEKPIDLLFIDGGHDYEEVKLNTLSWEDKVSKGGTILFHDYDHPKTKQWLDEKYGDNKEIFHGKIVKVVV